MLSIDSSFSATCTDQVKEDENQKNISQVANWSYSDLKSCMIDLGKNSRDLSTNLEGIDSTAVALKCGPGATHKLSTFFTPQQLELGKPIPADHPEVYVYLTSKGFQFAEYPSFYYFVKYNDGSNAIDVGTSPSNILPLTLPDGKMHIIAETGVLFSSDEDLDQYSKKTFINGTAVKSKAKYVDKYKSILNSNKLPPVVLKSTLNSLTMDEVTTCFMNEANHSLHALALKFYKSTTSEFDFNKDTSELGQITASAKRENLVRYKEKYKKNKDEMLSDYILKMRNESPNCKSTFSDQDYKKHAENVLSTFLDNYLKMKKYVDSI